MKLRVDPFTVVVIFCIFFYSASVADRAVESGDLNNITKTKVVAVVKSDVQKVKEEVKKIVPNNTVIINE